MFSLSQKLKWPKTCGKRFYKKTKLVPCKKPLEKTPNIREMTETILKIGHLAKAIVHAKAIAFEKMVSLGQKLKWPKRCAKRLYKKTRVVLCKKPLEKTPNIREMRRF